MQAFENMPFAAHASEDGKFQLLSDHLYGTAKKAGAFADAFGAEDLGYLAGLMHDIGKYSKEFQDRIFRNGPKVDHSTAGAYECATRLRQPWPAFVIAGHHTGLPDMGTGTDGDHTTLLARLEKAREGRLPDYSAWQDEISPKEGCREPEFVRKDPLTDNFFGRMLYSCLVDADYLDTEDFMKEGDAQRHSGQPLELLDKRLDEHIQRWYPPKTELDRKRCQILDSCIMAANKPPGLFTLTVPTGGGKTTASLAFAIKHAIKNGLSRVIYVIPYTSIIEQTADVFRKILGDDCVLEHHSAVEYVSDEDADIQSVRFRNAAENWDMTIVVSTAVQFFESIFSNRSSRCRKLHNIAKSVIIFDEAQMLPLPYLRSCVYAISQLVLNYHVSAVLCTATQPSLDGLFREAGYDKAQDELCGADLCRDDIFKRVTFKREEGLSWEEVAEAVRKKEQVLCIVNKRESAQRLFRLLKKDGTFHLSTLMSPVSRKETLARIRQRLREGKTCRVISTSLVEAGVDIDFPFVMREENGLDSILQAAGRCNREGKRSPQESIVTVFSVNGEYAGFAAINIGAAKAAMDEFKDPSDPGAISLYYHELYDLKGRDALDAKGVMKLASQRYVPYKKIAEAFKLIEQDTFTVYIPQDQRARSLIDQRAKGYISRDMVRELGRYGVNVYEKHIRSLLEKGAIEPLDDGSYRLTDMAFYDKELGLCPDLAGTG